MCPGVRYCAGHNEGIARRLKADQGAVPSKERQGFEENRLVSRRLRTASSSVLFEKLFIVWGNWFVSALLLNGE